MIVITGKMGVGKTTILNELKTKNIIYMDDIIKNSFYKRNFKLYWDIKENFGNDYVTWRRVNTKKLGTLVFNNKDKLHLLNMIVMPYIKTYLNVLKQVQPDAIVEMAIYINHESDYKDFFDKVVLINRSPIISGKINYLAKDIQPISNNKIKFDLEIKDENLNDAVKKLNDFLS